MPPAAPYDRELLAGLLQRVARLRVVHERLTAQTQRERARAQEIGEQVRTRRRLRWQARYDHSFSQYDRLFGRDEFSGD